MGSVATMGSSDRPKPPGDQFIMPFAFPVVDAAMHEYWVKVLPTLSQPRHIDRVELTTGSVEYGIHLEIEDRRILTGTILIRAVTSEQTFVGAEYGRGEYDRGAMYSSAAHMADLLPRIVDYMYAELDMMTIDSAILMRRPTPGELTPDVLAELGLLIDTATIPDIPDPNSDGYPAVFAWDKRYGRQARITSDKELARKLGLSHDHIRAMRVKHGEPRRNTDRD